MTKPTDKIRECIPEWKPCRVRRYAVVEILSEVIHADEPELALLALDRAIDYDRLLRNLTGSKMIDSVQFAYLDGAELESIEMEEMTGLISDKMSEKQIEAIKKKYAPGRRASRPSSGPSGPRS